ncbi:MAG: hypothetical protein IE931_10115 [Sphingobacteriales bacterium]|nr:hypothetical protein [Sphingobacteriales bacterium]
MKLLIITAVADFEKQIKVMLKKSGVNTFSYKYVTGYRDQSADAIETNWFASEVNETESILFYAFIDKNYVDSFFLLVDEFNQSQKTHSHIHLAVVNIEKSNS